MQFHVAAYACSPNGFTWDLPELETTYYERLKENKLVRGLEHPFINGLHLYDDEWFLSNIDTQWEFAFTCIPGVMMNTVSDPHFGLASDDEGGRQRALAFYKNALSASEKLNKHCGRQAVKAILVYSGPLERALDNGETVSTSRESMLLSMEELLSWDWQGAKVLIEHCDKLVEGQTPSKGYMSIEDELEVLKTLKGKGLSNCGILINWGRSVIEGRSKETVLNHLRAAKDADLLEGLMFSGCTDTDCDWGAWEDSHMPPSLEGSDNTAPSLLTKDDIHKAFEIANPDSLTVLGLKISVRDPLLNSDISPKVDIITNVLNNSLELVDNQGG